MQGDPKGALETFERGILAWPNNSGARFLAGIAARDLGDLDRAISELREAVRANNAETNAAIELSRIYYQRGDYQQAITFANTALRGPKGLDEEEAYVIAARASTAQHNDEQALRTIALLNARGHPALATREHAIFERTRSGPRAALVVIEASGLDLTDPKNEMVLRQSAESLTLLERSEQAVAEIDAALARTPDSAALHELRGIVLLRANQLDEARLAFEKAASLDDGAARPLAGLASIDAIQGDSSRAIEQFDRAYLLDPTGGGEYAYSAAQLVLASNDTAGAEARLRDIVRRNPNIIGARNDLAWILSEKGQDLDLALELAEDAYRRNPSPKVLDTLGWVYFKRGEITQAVDLLEMSAAQQPDSASVLYRLGAALTASGDENRAREMLQRALVTENFPEVDDARRVLAQLERR